MAWTDPITFVSGNVLTAAQMNVIQANLLAGGPTYTTEAARTTAIPSPFEGQRAYLTGSTIAAATGVTTAVPTGIQTIYNGAAWVCVTPVASLSNTTASLSTLSAYQNTLTSDTTAISVTLQTGTTAKVDFSSWASHSAVGGAIFLSIAVSGATTIAAQDIYSAAATIATANNSVSLARSYVIGGLTAGTNTFTLNYKTSATNATYYSRSLVVSGVA